MQMSGCSVFLGLEVLDVMYKIRSRSFCMTVYEAHVGHTVMAGVHAVAQAGGRVQEVAQASGAVRLP